MKNTIYVIGHKNPDCDSIVSAIAYAEYKKALGENAIAGRIGPVSSDVEYLLDRFNYEEPLHLYTAKSVIGEIEYDEAVLASKDITVKEALRKIMSTASKSIFVVDKNKKLEGLLSLSNLNELWTADERLLARVLKTATLNNIVKILKADIINKASNFNINGYLEIAPVDESEIDKDDIIITSNSNKIRFMQALEAKAGLIIIVGSSVDAEFINEAKKADVNVIRTDYNALKISKLIYQTPTISQIMVNANKVYSVNINETVDVCLSRISKTRFRSYPIIDENGKVVGSLSRYHLNNYEKKKLILVDHNESKQSIDDIEAGEVLEIVDHHRIGDFESNNPIAITTMVVGATATIIAKKFIDEKIKLSKNLAGILLGAILSDTMNFKSPTTTATDKDVASALEKICKVDSNKLYEEIVKHEESIKNRRTIDILNDDYKEYDINGFKIAIAQAACKDKNDFLAVKDALKIALEDTCKSRRFNLMICMLTSPTGAGSYLMAAGDKKSIIDEIYPVRKENDFVSKLVSRKKQLLPAIIKVLS